MKRQCVSRVRPAAFAWPAALVCLVMAAGMGWAQGPIAARAPDATATGAAPEFEAATIKPVKDPEPGRKIDREEGRRLVVENRTLAELLVMAYDLDRRQVVGGPGWVTSDMYDLNAVAENDDALKANGREMFQRLLTERFRLVLHWEQREMPVYVLTVAKGGSKLMPADASGVHSTGCQKLGLCTLRREDMQHFANWLEFAVLDKPVEDKTGLTGEFDFTLKWTPDDSQFFAMGIHAPPGSDDPNAPPGLYQAMAEELGLKLTPEKTQAEVLVIDHAERPAED